MTAAPPRTDCGIMEINAASFGHSPHRIKKIAPVDNANRLTTFVIVTRPTFWLNEVFGSTPNNAANEDPSPSHITPPESSLSVASLPSPPSITPEISPTVSTAVTINIIRTGSMALRSKTGFTGINFGISNQEAAATLSQFRTHAFVYSTPSALTPVVGKTIPMINAAMYPKTMPSKMDEELKNPFVKCLKNKITASTNNASNRFSIEPKSAALFPPPNELIPTEIRLSPIDITTVPVTTAGKNRRSGFKKKPKTVSNNPPIIEAPMIAP